MHTHNRVDSILERLDTAQKWSLISIGLERYKRNPTPRSIEFNAFLKLVGVDDGII